jgi:solute carrier family 25 citrate transporter 1
MPAEPGQTALGRITTIASQMGKVEGIRAFWMGITPRVMRVAPGQAVTFTVYEYLKDILEKGREMAPGGKYEE